MHKHLSKGHRSLIKKYFNSAEIKIYSYANHGKYIINNYLSKFNLSNKEYYSYLNNIIKNDNGEIHVLLRGDKILGIALFIFYGKAVHYVQAKKMDDIDYPIHHLILWNAILDYKNRCYDILDLGVSCSSSQLNYIVSEKIKNILLFKKGFGPAEIRFDIGEKYYCKKTFIEMFNNRNVDYSSSIKEDF